ncbi:TIGR02300 family protein [Hyphomicrobium sp. D-2]|uniref:TIGR02300 family protein n=1 Tax=Hyphomicrobium sp. D-2 TaxID=3041621 RepID=UPI0024551947|nr:TIGR02300 family protein [Hyphomicrobium sp. D-2]MDH4983859.1 TIGR02300 family protein [Hyphomicrobium sp. D-2]
MATNKERGTKRTCQNGDCSARFYDLNRSPIVCPICSSKYTIAHATGPISSVVAEEKRKVKKPEFEADAENEAEDDLVDVDADDADEAVDDAADETFLEEEEEDGGDVTGIIGSAVDGEEES